MLDTSISSANYSYDVAPISLSSLDRFLIMEESEI